MTPDPVRDATGCTGAEVSAPADTRSTSVDFSSVKQLVRAAVLRGLCLDDPWRHAYLRDRWTGRVI
jgi:hypothetical protein